MYGISRSHGINFLIQRDSDFFEIYNKIYNKKYNLQCYLSMYFSWNQSFINNAYSYYMGLSKYIF